MKNSEELKKEMLSNNNHLDKWVWSEVEEWDESQRKNIKHDSFYIIRTFLPFILSIPNKRYETLPESRI